MAASSSMSFMSGSGITKVGWFTSCVNLPSSVLSIVILTRWDRKHNKLLLRSQASQCSCRMQPAACKESLSVYARRKSGRQAGVFSPEDPSAIFPSPFFSYLLYLPYFQYCQSCSLLNTYVVQRMRLKKVDLFCLVGFPGGEFYPCRISIQKLCDTLDTPVSKNTP